jgi:hypothetical protein
MLILKLNIQRKVLQLKNKTKTYLLIVAVVAIWGAVGYQIISGVNTDNNLPQDNDFNLSFKPKTELETKTFAIEVQERDPFLGTLRAQKVKTTVKKSNYKPKPKKEMPQVTYTGIIKRENGKNPVFIVNILNKQYRLKKGQVADSIKLVKGDAKSIVVRYKSETKTIKRQ